MLSTIRTLCSKVPGGIFVASVMVANILTFLFSLYLSHALTFEQFGQLTLLNTLSMVISIVMIALAQTANHRTAHLLSTEGEPAAASFMTSLRRRVLVGGTVASLIWLLASPLLGSYFNLSSILPLVLFAPIIIAGCLDGVSKGYLQGSLAFSWLAAVTVIEPFIKLLVAVLLVTTGHPDIAYLSITVSVLVSMVLATLYTRRLSAQHTVSATPFVFPYKFMAASITTTLAFTAFITLDVLLAKHYLSPEAAGQYATLSLVGKVILFFGSLFNTILITLVSRAQANKQPTRPIFYKLTAFAALASGFSALVIGLFGHILVPLLFGAKSQAIIQYLPSYAFAMAVYSVATAVVAYHLARQKYRLPVITTALTALLGIAIALHHDGIQQIVEAIVAVAMLNFIIVFLSHLWIDRKATAQLPVVPGQMRILHLGFEDFRRPGSGGGAIRTHEINKRLAKTHDITVLTSRYRGSQDRIEDGVHYVHIGRPWGYFGSILTYFLAVPFAARRYAADLVVEDFAAPFSSCLSPLWTRRKTVAMVQWLNAREKSKQYHLPFWAVEKLGLRLHSRYIAVSSDLSDKIIRSHADAVVHVIGNGVPAETFAEPLNTIRHDIVFLGRLEREQKGIDLLLDAYAAISSQTKENLIIVGDGPDESWLRGRISELNLDGRVQLVGRINGRKKDQLLASAKVVAMPSRFETFGMVAVEAMATGTPVVAFTIPCLREVVPAKLGSLVPAFDTNAFGAALLSHITARPSKALEAKRRSFARSYDWDVLADMQETVYRNIVEAETDAVPRKQRRLFWKRQTV